MKYKVIDSRGHCFKVGPIIEKTKWRHSNISWCMIDDRKRTNWVYTNQMVKFIPKLNTKIKVL